MKTYLIMAKAICYHNVARQPKNWVSLLFRQLQCLSVLLVSQFNKPTLWGSSVKLGRSRLPASAWLSWSTSYMLYDGFPISTFIPPFVMGCLWTRFPLRCVPSLTWHATHCTATRGFTQQITQHYLPHLECVTMLGRHKSWIPVATSAKIRCSAEHFETIKLKKIVYFISSKLWVLGFSSHVAAWFLFLKFVFHYLFTYLCLRLQM